jgi:replicative DNA helicase
MEKTERRIPPHSVEAEQSVLGSMLLDPNAVITAIETLIPEDFYINSNRIVFEAMQSLYAAGAPVDLVTVTDRLSQRGMLETAGGVEYLSRLSTAVPTTANVAHYVSIVEDRSLLRGVIHAGSDMVGGGFEASRPADQVLSDAHDAVYALSVRKRSDSLRPVSEALLGAYNRTAEALKRHGGITGTPSGFPDLDRLTGGFEPGQMIVLAARPGSGKTSLALNIAHRVAVNSNLPVAFFSLEMTAEDLALRMMCSDAEVNLGDARAGRISDQDFARLLIPMRTLSKAPIYIDASGSVSVQDIRARCMRLSAKHKLGLIIIDYLQLMQGTGRRSESRTQEVSDLTRSIKLLARDVGTPIMILSQLNRDIERRTGRNRRPMLADLRESGSIEQDADIVIFLAKHADLRSADDDDDDEIQVKGERELVEAIVAKNRNGPTTSFPDDIHLIWMGAYTKFVQASDRTDFGDR